jgi:hypothetical protein
MRNSGVFDIGVAMYPALEWGIINDGAKDKQ